MAPRGIVIQISGDGLKFAAQSLNDKAPANKKIRRGAVIRVQKDEKGNWTIQQLPEVEAAAVRARLLPRLRRCSLLHPRPCSRSRSSSCCRSLSRWCIETVFSSAR